MSRTNIQDITDKFTYHNVPVGAQTCFPENNRNYGDITSRIQWYVIPTGTTTFFPQDNPNLNDISDNPIYHAVPVDITTFFPQDNPNLNDISDNPIYYGVPIGTQTFFPQDNPNLNDISDNPIYYVVPVIGGGGVTWAQEMLASYVSINDHATFTESQQASILTRLEEDYVVSTFGPDGLNKTVCDFFLFFENLNTSTALATRTITKTGETLRWNYGNSNIYTQNNLPAQINNGVISVTSVDVFSAITAFDIHDNSFTGIIFNIPYYLTGCIDINISQKWTSNYGFTGDLSSWVWNNNITTIDLSQNYFTGDLLNWEVPDACTYLTLEKNYFSGTTPNYKNTSSGQQFIVVKNNLFNKIGLTNLTTNKNIYHLDNNYFSTPEIGALINRLNIYLSSNTPTANSQVTCEGVYNGTILNGESNADLVSLDSIFTSVSLEFKRTYNDTSYLLTELDKPYVVFSWDDGNETDYTKVYPLLKSKGVGGTLFIYDDWANIGFTLTQLNEMITDGFDPQGHPPGFEGLVESEIRAEMVSLQDFFTANSISMYDHMAYGGGVRNTLSDSIMPDYVSIGRGIGTLTGGLVSNRGNLIYKDNNRYNEMGANSFDGLTDQMVIDAKTKVDQAIMKNAGLIFYGHTQTDAEILLLGEIIDYIQSKNVDIITIDQLHDKLTAV